MKFSVQNLCLLLCFVICSFILPFGCSTNKSAGSTFMLNDPDLWMLRNANQSIVLKGDIHIPGSVHMHLLKHGLISEPYFGYNDLLQKWIVRDNWTYEYSFDQFFNCEQEFVCEIVCDGLDTVSQIKLDNVILGKSDNMFRRWTLPVLKNIQVGSRLSISFTSALSYSRDRRNKYPYFVPSSDDIEAFSGEPYRNYIRKMQSSFAWDWGPSFPTQAIHKDIYIRLLPQKSARIDKVVVQTEAMHSYKQFKTSITTYMFLAGNEPRDVRIDILLPKENSTLLMKLNPGINKLDTAKVVSDVELWWPNGYGNPVLYNITVQLSSPDRQPIDYRLITVGFRDIKLVTDQIVSEEQTDSRSFFFNVNGIPIFAKGANFIPMDSFLDRVTNRDVDDLLDSVRDSNMNMIRVWGGGLYQSDYFYERCDQLGILVWQEMMFACANYPRDSQFLGNIRIEVIEQIERLHHHPSIALWSGNNENEASLWGETWYGPDMNSQNKARYEVDYAALYFDTVYYAVKSVDKTREFWISSPSNGIVSEDPLVGYWTNPYSTNMGDVHYYNYNALCTQVSSFPRGRFISEYGWQSFPSMASLRTITRNESELLSPFSTLMMHRQHHRNGQQQILNQIQNYFTVSDSPKLSDFIYLSQIIQAVCIKAQTEYYRTNRNQQDAQTMGALYWQLNSIWQTVDWSSMEYGGKWKLLQYFARNFFSSMLISSYEQDGQYSVFITSDKLEPRTAIYRIRIIEYHSGKLLSNASQVATVAPLTSTRVLSQKLDEYLSDGACTKRSQCFLHLSLCDYHNQSMVVSENIFYPSESLLEVELRPAHIQVSRLTRTTPHSLDITLISDNVALFTWLDLDTNEIRGRFSDNGFAIIPMDGPKVVSFFTLNKSPIDEQLFIKYLTIRSLQPSY